MVVQDILSGLKYAETLGMPLLRGREIEVRDTAASPRIAVVNSISPNIISRARTRLDVRLRLTMRLTTALNSRSSALWVTSSGRRARKSRTDRLSPDCSDPGPAVLTLHDSHPHAFRSDARSRSQVRQMINQIDDKLPIFGVTTMDDKCATT